jgi:membrane-associated phospholipid phosphatase
MVQHLILAWEILLMKKVLILICLTTSISININAQQTDSALVIIDSPIPVLTVKKETVYNIKPWIDIPAALVFDAWSLYGMSVIYGRDPIPVAEIMLLDKNNINKFDRPITNNYSLKAKSTSDLFFYGSMPLPIFLMLDKKIRKDGLKIGLLFLETMGTTGLLYTSSAMIANRYRPYAYNPNVDMDTRTRGGARNSFYAGHPSVVATSTFFMAKVYADYHPNMKHKWILYTLAGVTTATTGILRLQAGQHFKTDVITGITIGTLVGILVPHLHKNKSFNNSKLALLPNFNNGGTGFTAFYKLGK